MIVKSTAHKRFMVALIVLSMIGVLFLLRMALVMGVSSYMNAEAQKEDGNSEIVAAYYIAQAFTGDFMEPYIAYYNAGTSLAKANQPEVAERLLDISLSKVDNAYNECYIRNNLAKVQEQLGDYYMISDMASTAETYYAKAVTTISESPAVCFPPPPSGGGGDGEPSDEPSDGGDGEPKEGKPKEGKDGEPAEQKEDQDGNPLTPQDDTPKDSENGENMKDTEERSKEKEGKAQEAQGESAEGKEQVEQEMDQSKSETDNQKDITDQQINQTNNQVDKPW
jgi:hypothetical protein